MSGKIVIADDAEYIRNLFKRFLKPLADSVVEVASSRELMETALAELPDLLLLDVNMPDGDLLDNLNRLKNDERTSKIPIMLVSGQEDMELLEQAFKLGADDFMLKPPNFRQLKSRVSAYLARSEISKLTADLARERAATYLNLAKLIESREPDTEHHLERVREYCRLLGKAVSTLCPDRKLTLDFLDKVAIASPLHDIGKSTIPDAILLKPEPLNPGETALVRGHSEKGAETILKMDGISNHDLIEIGAVIARSHHERWDGTGYPEKLKGEEIPPAARLVAICDVYDALRSARPRRGPHDHESASRLILEGKGSQFEPELVEAFRTVTGDFAEVREVSPG